MSLRGNAFLAVWNDVELRRDGEYNLWHTREHVPERAGVPGILEGRRYVAPEPGLHKYFTLYDLSSLGVLSSQPYLELLDYPTPQTLALRPALRNFTGEPCRVMISLGAGTGGFLATIRFERLKTMGALPAEEARQTLGRLYEIPILTALHLGAVEPAGRHASVSGTPADPPEPWTGGQRYVLVAEFTTAIGLDAALERIQQALALECHARGPVGGRWYELAFLVRHPGSGVRVPRA